MEFDISASTNWTYMLYGQAGTNGFFGKYGKDNNTADPIGLSTNITGAAASANAWLGSQVGHLVSGGGASSGSSSTIFFFNAVANPAVAFHGAYSVSGGNWAYFPGTSVSNAVGQWTSMYVTAEAPWGIVSFGKRAFDFGLGLQYSSGNRSEEYLSIVADYGPLQIGFGAYPWRLGDKIDQVRSSYWNYTDWGALRRDIFGFATYGSGPLEIGAGTVVALVNQGPESQRNQQTRDRYAPREVSVCEGWAFGKYNNGRLFFNAEADWYYRTDRFKASANGQFDHVTTGAREAGSGSMFRPMYVESWRYAAEGGVIAGPAKLTLMAGYVPGPDRRHGVANDRQAVIVDPDNKAGDIIIWDPDMSNAAFFGPYSMLLCTAYGSGVNAMGRDGQGYLADAKVFAAKIDYALAANLNFAASLLYAKRASMSGWGWGTVRPQLTQEVVYNGSATALAMTGQISYDLPRYADVAFVAFPNIPEDSLGWEINASIDWQLLEGWQVTFKGAYWQPGKWFSWACVDRKVLNWADAPASVMGITPGRNIDAVYGLNISMSANF